MITTMKRTYAKPATTHPSPGGMPTRSLGMLCLSSLPGRTALLVLVFSIHTLFVSSFAHAVLTQQQLQDLAFEARSLFTQANQHAQQGSLKAEQFYDQAILRFQKIIEQGQIANPHLYYNIANAYLLKGDVGRAILNYRRAQQLGSAGPDLSKNLATARAKRMDQIPIRTEKRVLRTLFFWHYDLAARTRFLSACICWVIACLTGAALLLSPRLRSLRFPLALAVILLLCFSASIALDTWQRHTDPQGVIIALSVIARQGDGENYPPSFADPLHSGAEFRLLERRPDWLRIQLDNGDNAWIPTPAAEII